LLGGRVMGLLIVKFFVNLANAMCVFYNGERFISQ